jgi:hypothetical protein
LKHGFLDDPALEANVPAERAEWMAIISECIERGVFARLPPPIPSKGVKVDVVVSSDAS